MAKRDVLKEFGITREQIEQETVAALGECTDEALNKVFDESVRDFTIGSVLSGRVVDATTDDIFIDVGYKSEGVVPRSEWDRNAEVKEGDEVEVLLESVEDEGGLVKISKRKADRIRGWQRIIETCSEGDIVTGRVTRKIKGGLLVDIGVPVFLPASQVDIRRPSEIADYIGMNVTCKILKIDLDRQNIVVSRRRLIEEQREVMKKKLLMDLDEGQLRKGKVKNIADFGAFVDLGGIDGLLHITDMSWGRISHPSEVVAIDDHIEVVVLRVDREKEKIALGLKQKTPSPWENIEEKYPVGSRVKGQVVNLMSYGAFVKLEDGVEGLVHISEMSWTRRINHPSEVVAIGDTVEVVILGVDKQKQEISLGMKQVEQNPWEMVEQKYPSGTRVSGRVRNITPYGAFIEIEEGIDGLLHVSDMSWTKKVTRPEELVKKGDVVETVVLDVDPEKRRIALGLKQLQPDPWQTEIPEAYKAGDVVRGTVTKLTTFGAFVELEDGLEGLLHISELSDKKISAPEEIVSIGDVVDVRVIRVEPDNRKIGLSLRPTPGLPEDAPQPQIVERSEEQVPLHGEIDLPDTPVEPVEAFSEAGEPAESDESAESAESEESEEPEEPEEPDESEE
jgi:small subunit ribosomal protein S1